MSVVDWKGICTVIGLREMVAVLAAGMLLRGAWGQAPEIPPFRTPAATETRETPAPPAPAPAAPAPAEPAPLPAPPTPTTPAASAPQPPPPEPPPIETRNSKIETALRLVWTAADHPSGLYYTKDEGRITVLAENPGDQPVTLSGQVEFGAAPEAGKAFEALSIAPLAKAAVPPRQRVKFEIKVTFAGPGRYELRYNQQPIAPAHGGPLECIFAPRGADKAEATLPWVAPLTRAALAPGYLADYAKQTSIRRFVLEDPWPTPTPADGVPRFGGPLALTARQLDDLLAQAAQAKLEILVRVAILSKLTPEVREITAFHQHITGLLDHGKGAIKALALDPARGAGKPEEIEGYRSYYLAGYEAAKKHDKSLFMLGPVSAQLTETLLLTPRATSGGPAVALDAYVDALASTGEPADLAKALALGRGKRPVWVLGLDRISPAVLLAEGATRLPPAPHDRGVTAHLFGGAACVERLHPGLPPYVAVFQGDGYAVAALSGLGAGTPLDVAWPGLPKRAGAFIEIADDTREMRVVDPRGFDVECRFGDTLRVPLDDRVRYVLQAGSAEDLLALLRTAQVSGLPTVEVTALAATAGELHLRLRNATGRDLSGSVRISVPGETGPNVLGEKSFTDLAASKAAEVRVPLSGEAGDGAHELHVDVQTKSGTQRVAVPWPVKPAPAPPP